MGWLEKISSLLGVKPDEQAGGPPGAAQPKPHDDRDEPETGRPG
jgi:hypothetical protein